MTTRTKTKVVPGESEKCTSFERLFLPEYQSKNVLHSLIEQPACSILWRFFLAKIGYFVRILQGIFSRKSLQETFKNVSKSRTNFPNISTIWRYGNCLNTLGFHSKLWTSVGYHSKLRTSPEISYSDEFQVFEKFVVLPWFRLLKAILNLHKI